MSSLTTDLRSTLSALADLRERLQIIESLLPIRLGNGGIVGGPVSAQDRKADILHYGGNLIAETVHPLFEEFIVHAPYDIEELLALVDRLLKDTEFYLAMRSNPCFPIVIGETSVPRDGSPTDGASVAGAGGFTSDMEETFTSTVPPSGSAGIYPPLSLEEISGNLGGVRIAGTQIYFRFGERKKAEEWLATANGKKVWVKRWDCFGPGPYFENPIWILYDHGVAKEWCPRRPMTLLPIMETRRG